MKRLRSLPFSTLHLVRCQRPEEGPGVPLELRPTDILKPHPQRKTFLCQTPANVTWEPSPWDGFRMTWNRG